LSDEAHLARIGRRRRLTRHGRDSFGSHRQVTANRQGLMGGEGGDKWGRCARYGRCRHDNSAPTSTRRKPSPRAS
jgi:hypothetical protein